MAIERIVPNTPAWDAYYSNHICRYNFAISQILFVQPTYILDAACGVGYGTKALSLINDTHVVGIDISNDALKIAKSIYNANNVDYISDDCQTMGALESFKPFDYIISFETLEHLKNPNVFLQSCFDHLKPGGKLIISTPNILVTREVNAEKWFFHEKEYEPKELVDLLVKAKFKNIQLYGQKLSTVGYLRQDIRVELNKIKSNPFFRLGTYIQKFLKGHQVSVALPEKLEDFEIVKYDSPLQAQELKSNKPFVLIAVCEKG